MLHLLRKSFPKYQDGRIERWKVPKSSVTTLSLCSRLVMGDKDLFFFFKPHLVGFFGNLLQ